MIDKQEIISIDGIATHIYRLGQHLHPSTTFVIIPGNPGLGGFYIPFAHQLFDLFHGKYAVLIISQAGHSPPLSHCFTLQEQIDHKLRAIEQLLPAAQGQQLILIGHSIGSYMLLQMLERLRDRYERAFLLFPTIERMAESEAGQHFQRWYPLVRYLLPFLCWFIHFLLPRTSWKRKVVAWYFAQSPEEDRAILVDTVVNDLLQPRTMKNILSMAKEEMSVVRQRPSRVIEKHLTRLTFYYGQNDHWVPDGVCDEMQRTYPRAEIISCSHHYLHAFVLKHSRELARFVFQKMH